MTTNPTFTSNPQQPNDKPKPVDELRERLAAIEHQRWSDWMEYMFDCAIKSGSDDIGIRTCGWPTKQFEHWQRQIETDYEDLSTKEKASDMEQVDRYWPLIEAYIAQSHLGWLDSVLPEEQEETHPDMNAQEVGEIIDFNQAIDTIKANAIKSVGGEL